MIEEKKCTKCGAMKDASDFYASSRIKKDGTRSLDSWCKECANKATRTRYHANPGRHAQTVKKWRRANLKRCRAISVKWRKEHRFSHSLYCSGQSARKYGHMACIATVTEIEAAFTGKCHVCGISESECNHKLCMDHSHQDGRFRGWLCHRCNKVLGFVGESSDLLLELAGYLMVNSEKREEAQRME